MLVFGMAAVLRYGAMAPRLPLPISDTVEVEVDGDLVRLRRDLPLASALIEAGDPLMGRSVKYHRPRAAFCLQGSCGACLVRIDGQPNQRACRTIVHEGMKVERQNVYPSAALDLFSATDFFFPRGMDHHTLFVHAPKPVHAVMQKVARQLAGLGRLPDPRAVEIPPARTRHTALLVVGGGPAGLAAATAAASGGLRVLLVDEQAQLGGSLLADPLDGPARAAALVAAASAAGVELLSSTVALAFYAEERALPDAPLGLVALSTQHGLELVSADRHLYATGSYDQNALFVGNDLPGIYSARAIGRLLVRDRVVPGKRAVVLGGGPYAHALTDLLRQRGIETTLVDGVDEALVSAEGHQRLKGVRVISGGKTRTIKCDLLAVAALPAPATELVREHGAKVAWASAVGGFHAVTDAHGRTTASDVWACGDVAGFVGTEAARESGARVGAAIIGSAVIGSAVGGPRS